MNHPTRLLLLAALAASAIGCSPPGAVNERAIIESTPNAEQAPYAVSREAYRDHMQERFKNMGTKTYGKQAPGPRKTKK